MAGEITRNYFDAIGFRPPSLCETEVMRQAWLGAETDLRESLFEPLIDEVKTQNPNIEKVIDHDKIIFGRELRPSYSSSEAKAYVQGLDVGYDFIIGSLTSLDYCRSSFKSAGDYLRYLRCRSMMPVKTEHELERVKLVRAAASGMRPGTMLTVVADYQRFLEASPTFSGLVHEVLERTERGLINFEGYGSSIDTSGMLDGIMHAASMYIQSREQRILSPLEIQVSAPQP